MLLSRCRATLSISAGLFYCNRKAFRKKKVIGAQTGFLN